jgi:quercetin dioxygenase-like cupin family protein
MTMQTDIRPYALAREEGSAIWFLGALTFVKATGESTGGTFGLIEQLIPAGFASPYHVHHSDDEAFYVLEGQLTFVCDGQKVNAGPGSYVFGPREIPHGFRIEGTSPARILILNVPSGFEQFVVEAGEPARELTLPPPMPPDMKRLIEVAAKYKIDILGPLPE